MARIAAIVLAAGRSTRMGAENKLLLTFNDKTMVNYVVEQLADSNVSCIYVVTGNESEAVKKSISGDVTYVHNLEFFHGLSTSVKAGIEALPNDIDGVMICLGDMPYITSGNYNDLIAAFEKGKIIAPTTNGKIGNPLIFAKNYFNDFEELEGDRGARKLLKDYPDDIIEVDVNSEAIFQDIDTPEEYEEI
ncbi:nucleotidyltransferase family protein [Pseudemcibacter aquimaris]|uniref:nucleotidyltransferase family protein n=1 Tax=Pseudemcibacter aquimaris TaxID=2857064 RepID=UPI002010CAA9|nr:nucleotidyltransferase family protein [Pseudemcibacter aquimaris]MCC3860509.1 nucleotidyltransferase family protein [Pseudemcibacter aquimaris]WDU59334.1 nucleotidyltransferase family protein [Pseudemcibacter aquimaris]